jgi:hypothetical protein
MKDEGWTRLLFLISWQRESRYESEIRDLRFETRARMNLRGEK